MSNKSGPIFLKMENLLFGRPGPPYSIHYNVEWVTLTRAGVRIHIQEIFKQKIYLQRIFFPHAQVRISIGKCVHPGPSVCPSGAEKTTRHSYIRCLLPRKPTQRRQKQQKIFWSSWGAGVPVINSGDSKKTKKQRERQDLVFSVQFFLVAPPRGYDNILLSQITDPRETEVIRKKTFFFYNFRT